MARPTLKTPELVQRINELLVEGNSMASICRMDGMPSYVTVWNWEQSDPEFLNTSLSARERGTHYMADDCLRISDDLDLDPRHKHIMVDTRLRLIGKWNRKMYGDKVQQELVGKDGAELKLSNLDDDALDAKVAAAILARAATTT